MYKIIILAVVAAICAASCTNEMPEIPSSELYTREWVKSFGPVDPAQNWNHASRGSVTVDVPGEATVEVTAEIGGALYLLARYECAAGRRRIEFDMPSGVREVGVRCGVQTLSVPVGGDVAFVGVESRAVGPSQGNASAGVSASLCADERDWWMPPFLNATVFRRKMPEGTYNINRPGVTTDFMFRFSRNEFVLRPLFWDTARQLRLGMFYLDSDGAPVHIPLYDMEKVSAYSDDLALSLVESEVKEIRIEDYGSDEGLMRCFADNGVVVDELTVLDNFARRGDGNLAATAAEDHNVTFACRQYLQQYRGLKNSKYNADGTEVDADKRFNYVYRWRFEGNAFIITYTYYNYGAWSAPGTQNTCGGDPKANCESYKSLVTKGIRVRLDDISREYGFYIQAGWMGQDFDNPWIQSQFCYSLSWLNPGVRFEPRPGAQRGPDGRYDDADFLQVMGKRTPRAATWIGEKYAWRYLSFEDGAPILEGESYNRAQNDFDMQDIVFLIDGVEPDDVLDKEPEKEPQPVRWIIACEDLGNKDDFDFNDVVFEVEHVAGERTARITPLAAGGTLRTYLKRNGDYAHPSGALEWHELFGEYDHTQMVNTRGITRRGKTFEIEVEEDFSLVSSSVQGSGSAAENYRGNMGGFHLEVEREDGRIDEIVPPGCGDAPQMLLIFQPAEAPWQWPIERHHIRLAYPEFEKWMNTPGYEIKGDGSDWFASPCADHTVARK